MTWTYAPCSSPTSGPTEWCRAATSWLTTHDPAGRSLGCFARRTVRGGSSSWSLHACGRAVDWRPSNREAGWRLWFRMVDSGSADLQLILWDGYQWGGRKGPVVQPIPSGADQHRDHLHIESRNAETART